MTLAVMALQLACSLSAPAYTALVAFGDSYTDTGNSPSSPPSYWNGRFSNGPLWIEYLSQRLGFAYNPANNFAVSGSESDELGVEINNFAGTTDSGNVLFAIWSGNNDFGNHLNIGFNDAGWNTQINNLVSSLMTASDLLYQKGARSIILFNQLDLTRVPYILNNYSASFRSYIAGKIQIFNSRLAQATPNLLNSHPGLQVYLIDMNSDFAYLLNSYSSLGFTQDTLGALNDPNLSDQSFSGPGANYVFWDTEHPTTKAHGLLAHWVANVLPAPAPPPSIAITTPQNGAQFTAPATIRIDATVVSNGWAISQVAFFQNGSLLGQLGSPPYTLTLSAVAAGNDAFSAQIAYGTGQTITSSPIQITVAPPPPGIAITTPQNGAQFTAPATIRIDAGVVSNGWAISQVAFFQNGSLLGQLGSPPYTLTLPAVATGNDTFSAQITYGSGQTMASSPIQVTVAPPAGSPPPLPWNHQDIGSVGQPGSAYYSSNGTFIVSGSGSDIWGVADSFQYLYQSFTGDGTIIGRVTSVQHTDAYSKAGLMFRETLDPSATATMVFIDPSLVADFQSRATNGALCTYVQGPSASPPYWLKLERHGATFSGYGGVDGTNWVLLGSVAIPMAATIYAGLAVTAHTNTLLNTSTFDNVQVAPSAAPVPPVLSIRRLAGDAIQLTITGSVGASYSCEASTNLISWSPIATNLNASGTFQIKPPQSDPAARSFFRVRLLP